MLTAKRNRLARAPNWLRKSIARTIRAVQRELAAIDHEIAAGLNASARLKPLQQQLTSVPGVGRSLGNVLLARLTARHPKPNRKAIMGQSLSFYCVKRRRIFDAITLKTESSWAEVGANTASPTGWLASYVELAGSLATC
jgi:hypothetical protein